MTGRETKPVQIQTKDAFRQKQNGKMVGVTIKLKDNIEKPWQLLSPETVATFVTRDRGNFRHQIPWQNESPETVAIKKSPETVVMELSETTPSPENLPWQHSSPETVATCVTRYRGKLNHQRPWVFSYPETSPTSGKDIHGKTLHTHRNISMGRYHTPHTNISMPKMRK